MIVRIAFIFCLAVIKSAEMNAQCSAGITAFPYNEGFEASDGGWVSGGAGNDWAWGAPSKPVISSAGGGTKCWVIGGLTGSSYTNSEASWIQSPCFDFTAVQHPYIEFKVFWEMEQRFDGASLQYSLDNGGSWSLVGSAGDAVNCLNGNWFNNNSINYLGPLTTDRSGWSGNKQPTTGSCSGGSGSNGWVTAKHTMPYLAGKSGVLFRFIFGAGTICNNYDGFAVDDIMIGEAAPNSAAITYTCVNNNTVDFKNASALCPTGFNWSFGDPGSGANNTSINANSSHTFSGPGSYTVTLTVSGPDNAPSTTTQTIIILSPATSLLTPTDCLTGDGGSATVVVTGTANPVTYSWNSSPVQTTATATNLNASAYTVTVNSPGACPAKATITILVDFSCIGIYFPSGFTPGNDRWNNTFGPLGSLSALSNYKFSIYNRWGERIFYSTNPYEKWDGTISVRGLTNGIKTDGNVFVWVAEFSLPGKTKELRKGTVVLIR